MPQNERSIIRSKIAPQIPLDDMILEDLYTGTSTKLPKYLQGSKSGRQYHLDLGTNYPQISINSYTFRQEEILRFTLNAYDFLPTVSLKVALMNSSVFKSHGIPKDGDILSLFIRAKDDAFKPVRNDYLVTNVRVGEGGVEGRGSTLEIDGELFIPHFHDEIIKSYTGTSFEVLQNICRDLNLGFATNESSTSDSQNWICSGDTYANFIPYVVKHSWKDEKSFYKCFIDVYYHLNFINVNNQVDGDGKLEAAILDTTMFKNYYNDANAEEASKTKTGKFLSDMDNLRGTNMYIRTYDVENQSSSISKRWGYKSYVQFFDQKSGRTWELFVDPIVSDGAEKQKILLKGRPFPKAADGTAADKYWETQNKYFWRGIQYRDVHDKYIFSEIWNERNLLELDKFNLNVHVERWNPNIYRGERIPLVLHTMGDTVKRQLDRSKADEDQGTDNYTPVLDQFYSGYYMVDGIKWTYTMFSDSTDYETNKPPMPSGFVQIFRMKRRELPVPGGPPSPDSANTPASGAPTQ